MDIKPKFRVVLYKNAKDFLSRVEPKTRQKILDNMDIARSTLDPKLLKKLTGDVWEFRTLYNSKQYRMLAFWDKRNNADTLVKLPTGSSKKLVKYLKKRLTKPNR